MISGVYSGVLRLAFRIYFIGALTLIGLIGSQCCKCAAKLDLLHGRTVHLHRMTGWLRPSDIATCIWKLRRLPGGLGLGIMMVIVSILTLTADLAVNILVFQSPQQGLCEFDYGLVMNWTVDTWVQPPSNSYPALLALNAQIYSLDNNVQLENDECYTGIFRKIPWAGNVTFCATAYDVMGYWDCELFGSDYNFDGGATVDDIAGFLYNNSLQYIDWSTNQEYITQGGVQEPAHLVIWSSSVGYETGQPFDVLASVDLNGTYTGTKTMRTYQCKVTSDSENEEDLNHINDVLSEIPSNSTLYDWAPGLEAILYMGDGTDIDAYAGWHIASRLNAMTMVQGGGNSIQSVPLDSDYSVYGCIIQGTYVSPAILALVGFTGFCLLTVTFYWIILLFRLGRHALPSFLHGNDTHSIKPVPDSILSWMLQASRENALGSQPAYGDSMPLAGVPKKERELHNWGFSVVEPGSHTARMVRTHGSAPPQMVEQVYMNVEQK